MTREEIIEQPKLYMEIPKTIIFIIAAFISFSLWLASTITTPKKLENIEQRLNAVEQNYLVLNSKISASSEDIRDIKQILMGGKK
ncbi:hypothetical protein Emin_1076 [Elusimicrobium minutum Pei191]|uniref:Uncharacterized protein n=1 Tax=Elusimicrobium minutum (strain Pei191) TaxID=445932 RepID=B2KDN2_ELUMP|nr:hypothetical protein [Elusimicrobium minutum]ACC98628.1 hypothetical protein Emin_1076 [Elusimicrobium minutum Pei191]